MTMTPTALQSFLHENIPLVGAMQIEVTDVTDEAVTLRAPLAPNRNHHATAFGGSIAAVAILSGWSLVHVRLHSIGSRAALVVRHSDIDYQQAATGDFIARASIGAGADWQSFERTLAATGKSRVAVTSELSCAGQPVARFNGVFVAFHKSHAS